MAQQRLMGILHEDGADIIGSQLGIAGMIGSKLLGGRIENLESSAQGTYQQAMIGRFGETPHAVAAESAGSGMIGFPHAMGIACQSTIIGTEIEGAIAHGSTADHHFGAQSRIRRMETGGLSGARMICHDARIIGSTPQNAVPVLGDGTYIAQRNGIELGGCSRIIAYTILTGSHPEGIPVIYIDTQECIVGDGSTIVRIVEKLPEDFPAVIYEEQAIMIGGKPHPALGIEGNILEQHLSHRRRHHDAHRSQEAGSAHKPLLLSLTIDIGAHIGSHPVVALVIYEGKRKLIGRKMMRGDEAILPYHLLGIAVETVDAAIYKGDQRLPIVLTDAAYLGIRQAVAGSRPGSCPGNLPGSLRGVRKEIGSLMLGIYEIDTLAIHADPHVLFRVDEDFLESTLHAYLLKLSLGLAVELLGIVSEDTIAHRGMYPQIAMDIFLNLIYQIVGNGMRIVDIAEEGLHAEAVEAVESRLGTQPYIAMTVLQYGIHLRIAQSVTIGQAIEFHRSIRAEGRGRSDGEHPAD